MRPGPWIGLSLLAALVSAVASAVGLVAAQRIYGHETLTLADAAAAQDVVNLVFVAPLTVALALRARAGSWRAYLCWLGCLTFTVYNYAIYAFSIHFGPLFLPWLLVLGLSFYALVGALAGTDTPAVKARFQDRAMPLTGWALIALATGFAGLWLSEIIPDLVAGVGSRSAGEWRVPTNPVHVLDLAFLLPAVLSSGVLLLRRRPLGYATAAGELLFLALTCLPILVTPFVARARGHVAGWAVTVPITVVLVLTSMVLFRTLRATAAGERSLVNSPG